MFCSRTQHSACISSKARDLKFGLSNALYPSVVYLAAKALASLRIRAGSPEPSWLAYAINIEISCAGSIITVKSLEFSVIRISVFTSRHQKFESKEVGHLVICNPHNDHFHHFLLKGLGAEKIRIIETFLKRQ